MIGMRAVSDHSSSVGKNSITSGDGFISLGSVVFCAIEIFIMICTMYAGVVMKNRNRNRIELIPIHRMYHLAEFIDRFSQKMSPGAGAYVSAQSFTDDGRKCAIICLATDVDDTVTKAIPSGSFMAAERNLATSPHSRCSSDL